MLRIRREQHDALGDKDFLDRLEVLVAEALFHRKVSAAERARLPLRAMCEHGVGVARGYGLETERDLTVFVLNMITINPEFHRQPHIHDILRDPSLSPPDRREKLLMDVSDEAWDEAARMTDADRYWTRVLSPEA
ncbi:hypothetical protein [Chondromyces crocatus]|uniref:Uncharacterized protein n=1 Tax=Chondromyces crocatus TaxID=52 RepID=A0A0K1EPV6_CHOCO|nr:hypothetical protein [Chondromyces crocatus]AKT42886.1 uncharacterized protein CMC5_071140 [Chondromyces crocatus]